MKHLWLTVGLLAFSAALQAQVLDARADVPFDFWLGQKLMPAGSYSIYHSGGGAVLIQGEQEHRAAAQFLGNRISPRETRVDGKLEFIRYGNVYFLSKIWNPYGRDSYGVPKSAREKELARGIPSKMDVALSTK